MKNELNLHDFLMRTLLESEIKEIEKLKPSFFKSLKNKSNVKTIDVLNIFAFENQLKIMPIIYSWVDMLNKKGKEDFGAFILNSIFKENDATFNKVGLACLSKSIIYGFHIYSSYPVFFKKIESLSIFLNGLYDKKGKDFFKHWNSNLIDITENIGPFETGKFAFFFKDIDIKVNNSKEKWDFLIDKTIKDFFDISLDKNKIKSSFLNEKLSEESCSSIYYMYEQWNYPKDKKEVLVIDYFKELKEDYVKGQERKCTLHFLNYFYKKQLESGNDMFLKNKDKLLDLDKKISLAMEINDVPKENSFTVNVSNVGISLIISLTTYAYELTDSLYPNLKKYEFSKSDLNMSSVLMNAIKKIVNSSYPEDVINVEYDNSKDSKNPLNSYGDRLMKINVPSGNKDVINGLKSIMEEIFLSYDNNFSMHREKVIEKVGSVIEYTLMKKDVLETNKSNRNKIRKF